MSAAEPHSICPWCFFQGRALREYLPNALQVKLEEAFDIHVDGGQDVGDVYELLAGAREETDGFSPRVSALPTSTST